MKNFMKLSLASALLAVTATANAFDPRDGGDIVVYHGGASASSGGFFDNVRSLCVGDADVFTDSSENQTSVTGPTAALDTGNTHNGEYWIVACEVDATSVDNLGGTRRMIYYKRDDGGSGMGVFPIAAQSQVAFMAAHVTNCPNIDEINDGGVLPADKTRFHICTGYTPPGGVDEVAVPTLGSSDVEPNIFSAALNAISGIDFDNDGTNDPNPSGDLSALVSENAGYLGFGVVGNVRLYQALQVEQFPASSTCNPNNANYGDITVLTAEPNQAHCMPSLTTAGASTLFASGRLANTLEEVMENFGDLPANGNDGDATDDYDTPLENLTDTQIHICRRTPGSGTQAQHQITYFNYPCERDQDGGIINVETPQSAATSGFGNDLSENGGSSGLARCLKDFQRGGNESGKNAAGRVRPAIGLQSTTRDDTISRDFRYFKIDGVAPTIQNMHNGSYKQWYGQSFQRSPAQNVGDVKLVLDEIVEGQNDPALLATFNETHGWGVGGWVAVPTSSGATVPSATFDPNNPVGRFERVDSSGNPNSCAFPRARQVNGVDVNVGG